MSGRQNDPQKALRTALCLILVVMYAVGLIAIVTFSFSTGMVLWAISTIGGMAVLYWIRSTERREAEAREAEKARDGEKEKNDAKEN